MTLIMEQLTMVTLLFIRWIIPRPPSMTREQLAANLGGWMGIMADQLNFLVLLDEDQVFTRPHMLYLVLLLFSISQMQFSLVFSARVPAGPPNQPKTFKTRFFASFLWNSVCLLCLQDVPFVVTRSYCVFHLGVLNHTVFYFIGKNLIVIMLQIYRITWLLLQEKWSREKEAEDKLKMEPLVDRNTLMNGNISNGNTCDDLPTLPWIDDEMTERTETQREAGKGGDTVSCRSGSEESDDVNEDLPQEDSVDEEEIEACKKLL